jgi:hypothetical protein
MRKLKIVLGSLQAALSGAVRTQSAVFLHTKGAEDTGKIAEGFSQRK